MDYMPLVLSSSNMTDMNACYVVPPPNSELYITFKLQYYTARKLSLAEIWGVHFCEAISWMWPSSGLDTTFLIQRSSSPLVVDLSKASRTIEIFFWTANILTKKSESTFVAGWSRPSWCAWNEASRRPVELVLDW